MKGPLSSAADAKLYDNLPLRLTLRWLFLQPNRVIETTSPEDGGALTFTLYKVVNGLVDTVNSTGKISLDDSEAISADKKFLKI